MSKNASLTHNLLARCQWPNLPGKFDIALHEAVEFILQHFRVIGIVAAGAIVRGKPDAASDLDIYVIHGRPFRQRIQKFFNGIPAEIFINPQVAIERYFVEEHAARRPITAHMLSTGFVILELDPLVEQLRQKASRLLAMPPEPPVNPEMDRYLIASLYEDALDVTSRNPTLARLMLFSAVLEMLKFCFVRAGRFIPRTKDLLHAVAELDEDVAQLAERFIETPQLAAQVELAGCIADRTLGARGFFEWETVPEVIVG